MRKLMLIFMLSMITGISVSLFSQPDFSRGVNLTGWFQVGSAKEIQFTRYTRQDFKDISSLGCDLVRLPINLHFMTSGSPDYVLDPLFLMFLDSAITWAEENNLYLILDNHTFDPAVNTDPKVGEILNKVWKQMAARYKNSSEYILYEILNEPHGISTGTWSVIQQDAIDVIRSEDTTHYIVVGGAGWNGYGELKNLPVYTDTLLIYTFHFYDPFLFTHQGASWTSPSMEPLAGVPFPYNASAMPACPATLKGTWIESSLNNYRNDGLESKVKSALDVAVSFKNSRNVPVFCGEFGVYIPNSEDSSRVYWYEVVREYLEENGISWTIWDYKGGFGLFEKNSREKFRYDLNIPLVEALGFIPPAQEEFSIVPDTVGFPVYSDFTGMNINSGFWGSPLTNFYSDELPNNGNYCLFWTGSSQYTGITFDFDPEKDLSELVEDGYGLDLFVRGLMSTSKFDIRFLDTKASPEDHPWRMGITIDKNNVPMDLGWHHLHIPLSNFTERGSWDTDTWYNPAGLFDWHAVDRLEIIAEYGSMAGKDIWFDNIFITDQDTAQVLEDSIIIITTGIKPAFEMNYQVYPNPFRDQVNIALKQNKVTDYTITIMNLAGYPVRHLCNSESYEGNMEIEWDGKNDAGVNMPSGLYLLRIMTEDGYSSLKLIKQ